MDVLARAVAWLDQRCALKARMERRTMNPFDMVKGLSESGEASSPSPDLLTATFLEAVQPFGLRQFACFRPDPPCRPILMRLSNMIPLRTCARARISFPLKSTQEAKCTVLSRTCDLGISSGPHESLFDPDSTTSPPAGATLTTTTRELGPFQKLRKYAIATRLETKA